MVAARTVFIGSPGCVRSSACAWLFSSQQAEGHSRQQSLKFQTEWNTALDLTMLVKQLLRVVHLTHPDSALATRAMDFLQRHGLLGSPLREQLATAEMCENRRPSKLVDDFMEDVGLFARLYPPPGAVDRPTSSPDPDEPHQPVDGAPTLSRSDAAMAAAIDVLQAAGFAQDGATRTEVLRIPTKRSPVYGRSGGELVKLGGRMRFSQAGTSVNLR